ncbi:tetratricopeptide repeat protein [Niabella terrae]
MNKTIHLLALGVMLSSAVFAQSVEDGVKDFYNGNYDRAISVLEKQSTDANAAYWLAESYFYKGKNEEAKNIVTKALTANPNNYLLLAAKGQSQLLENKASEAHQSFEAAITAAGKKDEDKAQALNAVGRAISKVFNNIDKVGDIKYGVQKLEEAKAVETGIKDKKQDKTLLADILTNLGNAYLKANPGDGSKSFSAYQDALLADPTFAAAEYQKARIFRSQRNTDMYLQSLTKATAINSEFYPALDDLYEYNAYTAKSIEAAKPYGDKLEALMPPGPNNQYFKATAAYFTKNYNEAITIGKDIIAKAGAQTNPKVYKLVAYALIDNKDTAAAIPFVEDYFKNQDPEELVTKDYILKATAYSTTPGREAEVVKTFEQALAADTSVDGKIEVLETGAKTFANGGRNALAGDLYAKILEIKPKDKLTINDFFNAGYTGYYKAGQFDKAWTVFDAARTRFPNWNYGYKLAFSSSQNFDSVNAQNKLVPDGEKYIAYLQSPKDTSAATTKRAEILTTAIPLFTYYANVAKDNAKTLQYLHLAHDNADNPTVKEQIAGYITQMGGTPGNPNAAPATDSTQAAGSTTPAADSSSTSQQ